MNMKKILFISRDPGGTNALIPVAKAISSRYCIEVYGKDDAINRYEQNGIHCKDIKCEYETMSCDTMVHFLKKILPDLIITGTSADDYTEKYIWIAAKRLQIPSIAVIDQWVNYGIRFSRYSTKDITKYNVEQDFSFFPDYIFTLDDYARTKMIEVGIPEEKIIVTGQPHFEFIKKRVQEIPEEDVSTYKEKVGCKGGKRLIVFASDNISQAFGDTENKKYWGYNERTIFPLIYNALCEDDEIPENTVLLIRPHPKEDASYWEKIVEMYKGIHMYVDQTTSGELIIKAADLVISMQSMFLLEALLAGKDIMSVQIGLNRENPLILQEMGLINTILEYKTLKKELRCFYENLHTKIAWDIADGAIEKIDTIIEEMLCQN